MAVYFIDIIGQPEFGDMSAQLTSEEITEPILDIQSDITNEVSNDFLTDEAPMLDFSPDLNSDVNPFDVATVNIDNFSAFGAIANEITDFGNQDNSVSVISYDLSITGLDTKEVMVLFKEAIEDQKFGWMPQDIFSKIKNGECLLKDLNPIQAFVLAKRIQFLDIETEWKQNVQV